MEYVVFIATLLGVALSHQQRTQIAIIGLVVMISTKLLLSDFSGQTGWLGFVTHCSHEAVLLLTLLGPLTGFEVVAHHFKKSRVPDLLPSILPDDWKGGFVLLILIFCVSGFLDNIAAAVLGVSIAGRVFRRRNPYGQLHPHVHVGFLVAVVAAANAGGAGSVLGDTTTTMMWIEGHSPLVILRAYVPSVAALIFFGIFAARQQHRYQPILKDPIGMIKVNWSNLAAVIGILGFAIMVNILTNLKIPKYASSFPWIGAAVWLGIMLVARWCKPDWHEVKKAAHGAVFLMSLVLSASMVPVSGLPKASWESTFGLGVVSSFFDNIPLTALALKQGGYDWALAAFAVGFGGTMLPFGSSAGVSVTSHFPYAASIKEWLLKGWHVPIGYLIGFIMYILVFGWMAGP